MSLYIFGPIHSRRFGTSLGIDLSPMQKRCNFDCLYCELSAMPAMLESDAAFSVDDVINELQEALIHHPNIDVITLTANGEPSMYHDFDALVDAIKGLNHSAKLLILSNSALIDDKEIQKIFHKIDCVKLSLDAVTPDVFQKIDRPHESILIENIKAGMLEFSKSYKGELIIEILLVAGINDKASEIKALNDYLIKLNPFRIDIGTVDRPPAYGVSALSNEKLDEIALMFDSSLPISVAHRKVQEIVQSYYTKEEILLTLDKRPLTAEDVNALFDLTSAETLKELLDKGEVSLIQQDSEEFYVLSKNLDKKRKKS
jgi:wyosine [tRNA(Phe)-imidazoG37] synthetase (radical SAM superfamily)